MAIEYQISVRGNCGKIHASVEEWQQCKACDSVGKQEHCGVLMKDFNIIWNVAIEAAAKVVPAYEDHNMNDIRATIRSLKK